MNASEILKTLNAKCQKIPLMPIYEKTNDPYPNNRKVEKNYKGQHLFIPNRANAKNDRYKFIYWVIHENIYYINEGYRLRMADEEIKTTFTKFTYRLEVIESFEYLNEFTKELLIDARNVMIEESEEYNQYMNKGVLGELNGRSKNLKLAMEYLGILSRDVRTIDQKQKENLQDLIHEQISPEDFSTTRKDLEHKANVTLSKYERQWQRYKSLSESGKERRRKYLKCSFSNDILTTDYSINEPVIQFLNASQLTFLIREYCRWYNKRFATEIRECKRLTNNAKRRAARNGGVRSQVKLDRKTILQPYIQSKLSFRQIAIQTQIPKSTVRELLIELRS